MELQEALTAVIKECPDEYAKSYARAALNLGDSHNATVISRGPAVEICHEKTGKMMVGKEMKVQLLYVLSNTAYWRGERAREVKKVLKEMSR